MLNFIVSINANTFNAITNDIIFMFVEHLIFTQQMLAFKKSIF